MSHQKKLGISEELWKEWEIVCSRLRGTKGLNRIALVPGDSDYLQRKARENEK